MNHPLDRKPDHSHLCPSCFEHVPCNMDCHYNDELPDEHGLPTGHATECDECIRHTPEVWKSHGFDPIELGM